MHFFAASVWLAVALYAYWRCGRDIQGTTLQTAWRWGWAGLLVWSGGWIAEYLSAQHPELSSIGLLDQVWYLAALLILAALISVLGAKRPGSRVWTWFVTVPMLLVLGWPAGFAWSVGWPPAHLRLMAPSQWAVAVVAVMGLGNYIGTRYLFSAFWMGIALGWVVLPYSGWVPDILPPPSACRFRATLCASLAIIWPWLTSRRDPRLAPWDRVWCDFVNQFGIVWGRRLQDRFNDTARKAHWGVKLDFYGLTWDDATVPPATERAASPAWTPEMQQALEWLLRRFVDPIWIEQRLNERC